jgi:hypothetical protein
MSASAVQISFSVRFGFLLGFGTSGSMVAALFTKSLIEANAPPTES